MAWRSAAAKPKSCINEINESGMKGESSNGESERRSGGSVIMAIGVALKSVKRHGCGGMAKKVIVASQRMA